jgi:asparagine synthase (glutamine-hydrolysing)
MCGICGYIKFNRNVEQEDQRIISRMNSRLLHRGPDAQDTLLFDNIALGFTRLSIIGLENGMQPIFSEDESVLLICNGEIFNYIELRKMLQSKGHVFRTSSDVEVIIHLYEDHHTNFLNMLNGQFSFALYDKRRRQLFCARDQLGILPFFYTFTHEHFIFASEIKAILEYPGLSREVDLTGLDQTFTFAGMISPRTMFKDIRSLENGHYLTVDYRGEIIDKEYWDLVYPEGEIIETKKEDEYIDELEAIFENAVKLRLRADVPSGFYLSGGLDSSMIAMKVQQLAPGISKEAFSIDFMESLHSESIYQKLVAGESRARLNQKTFLYDDISTRLQHSVYHSECPIKETYNTASLLLSEAVRSKGIKVILSGEGADEFFAGYVGYRFDKMRAMNMVQNSASAAERQLRKRLWGDDSFFYEKNFLEFDEIKRALYSEDVNACFDEINCLNHYVINKRRLHNLHVLNKRAYIDYKIRLVDHLVSDHGDRMAMANSVEVRYPFLDKDLVEFSTRLPQELKLQDLTEKYILKRLASRFVPKQVFQREKFHFIAPGSPYLLQKNIGYVNDILSYDRIKRQGYFDADEVERLKKMYSQKGFTINAPFETDLLIIVITFGILLDTFFKQPVPALETTAA